MGELEPTEGQSKFDIFWQQNADNIIAQVKEKHHRFEELGMERLEKERTFAQTVIERVEEAMGTSEGQPIIVLFDIDHTIGAPGFASGLSEEGTTLRPVLLPLLEQYLKPYIDQGKIKMGILSSRSKEALLDQLEDNKHLKPINNYIDREFVFSSRTYLKEMRTIHQKQITGFDFNGPEVTQKSHGKAGSGLLQDESAEVVQPPVGSFDDLSKLDTLKDIRDQISGNIVVFDDTRYAGYLNPTKGLYGADVTRFAFYIY
jgi:hypothetical protein